MEVPAKHKKVNIDVFKKIPHKYEGGVITIELKSWNEFHNIAEKFNDYNGYLWRGQDKEQSQILSRIDRNTSDESSKQDELNKTLKKFKLSLKKHRDISNLKEDDIWAIGEHYGLITPLLNWTESPYIALYFAFYEKKADDKDPAIVYALTKSTGLLKRGKKRYLEITFEKNVFDNPQNRRLLSQKGKFTKSLNRKGIESIATTFWKTGQKKLAYGDEVIFAKILIPSDSKNSCLKSLKSMNITYETLFPDYAEDVIKAKKVRE